MQQNMTWSECSKKAIWLPGTFPNMHPVQRADDVSRIVSVFRLPSRMLRKQKMAHFQLNFKLDNLSPLRSDANAFVQGKKARKNPFGTGRAVGCIIETMRPENAEQTVQSDLCHT